MKRQKTVQKNYRFTREAIKLLEETAEKSGMTETDVVEACLSLFAMRVPELASQCRECLTQVVAGELGKASSGAAGATAGAEDVEFAKQAYQKVKAGEAVTPAPSARQQQAPDGQRDAADGQGRSPSKPRR